MQDEAGFYPPLQYQPQWLWLGLILVLVIVGWYAWIFRPVRKTVPVHEDPARRLMVPDLETLRATYLAAIHATALDADAGRLPERDAHQRLSFLVREFAGAASGLPMTSMTLEDLHRHEFKNLAAGIAGIYPSEFAPRPVHSVRQSAESARQVVLAWN
ncbi:hypothetical protein [Paenarthrobacter sp.]|uniref:hypothetical protein n=1 Tax=Paenarthrobacter sp. TaxID=1931993 RepID=UPI002811B13E|nr:hypothetical protein [Paenarthrobacter sp.]